MMSKYINIGNDGFQRARNGIYVDKSMLIGYTNSILDTEQNMTCVTRARRFGKSMAAKMLCAYYDFSCDSRALFSDLHIAQDASFETNLNQYPVIYLDITSFTTTCKHLDSIVDWMDAMIQEDLHQAYPDVHWHSDMSLVEFLLQLTDRIGKKIVMIIDEWDALFRELEENAEVMRQYVDWLRSMFKSGYSDRIFAGVYMTGIFPIKQYDTQSALNNFVHYSVVDPEPLSRFYGFTEDEVAKLCSDYHLDYAEMSNWYDGYSVGNVQRIFNPNSVMTALRKRDFGSYWMQTGAYEGLKRYIALNFDGLKDALISLLADVPLKIDVSRRTNEFQVMDCKESVLMNLVHLGYLTYNRETETVTIPNYEVRKEFEAAVSSESNWIEVARMIDDSEKLTAATLADKEDYVANAIDRIHADSTSILQYNDENSLASVLSLAYYTARKDFIIFRELPSGLGFADMVLLPKRNVEKPAVVLELKYDQTVSAAILQIKQQRYADALKNYSGTIILVAINYDKKSQSHQCRIERWRKEQ